MKILLLILTLTSISFAQNFEIKGNSTVENKGKINVIKRNVLVEQGSNVNNSGTFYIEENNLNSEGNINNENGRLILNYQGGTVLNQNEIKGNVEYINIGNQIIPALVYDSLIFKGGAKLVRKNNNTGRTDFEIQNLIKTDTTVDIRRFSDTEEIPKIYANKNSEHDGTIEVNNTSRVVEYILNTDTPFSQINGTGSFKTLELDKSNGATITRGGWKVNNRLTLRNGILYNSDESGNNFTLEDGSTIEIVNGNFSMMDEAGIIRYPQSRLNVAPNFEGTVLVEYTGNGPMEIGPEMPINDNVLSDLLVNNSEGTTFTRDAYISDRLTVGSNIYMDSDSDGNGTKDKENTLYYKGVNSGIDFTNGEAEIYGNFARTNLTEGESQTFNNIYTWVEFGVNGQDLSNNGGEIDTFLVRIEPNTPYDVLEYDEDSEFKVRRKIHLKAKDSQGNDVPQVNDVAFGYGWKHDPNNSNNPIHETSTNEDVIFSQLGLQLWDGLGNDWIDQELLQVNRIDTVRKFAYSASIINNDLGEFAVGMTIAKYLAIMAKAVLEGPHKGYGEMTTFLRDSSILDSVSILESDSISPPAEYPYNLDPNRDKIVLDSFPEGVVDWIVLEFRDSRMLATEKFYKTCFLTKDGSIVDTNGSKQIQIFGEDTGLNVKSAGSLYLAIRHRNHLAVVTENVIPYSTREATVVIDFTDKSQVYLGNSAVKVLGLDLDGNSIHGLVAGNVDRIDVNPNNTAFDEQIINDTDVDFIATMIGAWDLNPKRRYYRSDVNMDGIVTSRDYNYSWNNRGYISVVD